LLKKILVVDDDRDSAEMIAEFLAMQNYEATFALDGRMAIAIALEIMPDMALLDITLPDMTGYELARQLRAQPSLSGLLLVALTGWSGPEHEAKSLEAGFDHHMVKPIDFAKVQRLLERHRSGEGA
jgi:DNA-binding response OmpR family regulator